MQIGSVFISRFYKLPSSFVLGISFDITTHEHINVSELVVMIEFLFWGVDIQIDRL